MNKIPYIENVIVVNSPWWERRWEFFTDGSIKDIELEDNRTWYVTSRFIPDILLEIGLVSSKSEVKRNKLELFRELRQGEYLEVKWGKRKFWLVG